MFSFQNQEILIIYLYTTRAREDHSGISVILVIVTWWEEHVADKTSIYAVQQVEKLGSSYGCSVLSMSPLKHYASGIGIAIST